MSELKGKPLTLTAKVFGSVIAVVGLALKATVNPALDIDAVLKVAGFIVVVFAPVDLSLILEKVFKGGRV